MKKLVFLALFLPCFAFAADNAAVSAEILPPEIVVNILSLLQNMPVVGVAIVVALKWIAILAPIMTALSVLIRTVLLVPELVARYQGAPAAADKIKTISDKITYWVDHLSILNAKKPQ